jgi:drug/metabolite transporter (DMT)-like permease
MNDRARAHLALIGANLIYGVTYSIARQVVPEFLPPFALVFARISGAGMLFWITGLLVPRERIGRGDLSRLILASVFGVAVNQSLFLNGLSRTSPIDASIIMTATPILVMVVARILIKEPVTAFKIAGIVTGATGAILLIIHSGDISFNSEHFTGNTMIVANATSYAVYLVIIKPLLAKYNPLTLMKWIFLFGFLLVLGPGLPAFVGVEWDSLPLDIVLSVLFVVIATTFLAYLLINYSLKYVKPVTVSIYIYSQPLVASVTAVIMGLDRIDLIKVVSALLVFAGVYFVSYSAGRTGRG